MPLDEITEREITQLNTRCDRYDWWIEELSKQILHLPDLTEIRNSDAKIGRDFLMRALRPVELVELTICGEAEHVSEGNDPASPEERKDCSYKIGYDRDAEDGGGVSTIERRCGRFIQRAVYSIGKVQENCVGWGNHMRGIGSRKALNQWALVFASVICQNGEPYKLRYWLEHKEDNRQTIHAFYIAKYDVLRRL